MKKNNPLVTVIINNYNYDVFIDKAIDSALRQNYKNIEIIVVDDGSSDSSLFVIENYGELIKKIFKENGGQSSTFNAGFEASQGEIICFLDADDTFLPNKIATVVDSFNEFPDAGWFFHELQYTDIEGNYLDSSEERATDRILFKDFKESIEKNEKLPFLPATTGLSFSREILKKVLPMPEIFRVSADAFLRLASICQSPGILSPYILATHRRHGKNLFVSHPNMLRINSETDIIVSYYLRKKFPIFFKFTNRLFARSTGRLFAMKGFKQTMASDDVKKYLTLMKKDHTPLIWIDFVLCAFLNYFRVKSGVTKKTIE